MEYFTDNQPVRSEWRVGILASWLDSFASWLSVQGYPLKTIQRKLRLTSSFSRWLKQEAIVLANLDPTHSAQYLQYRWRKLKPQPGEKHTLGQLTQFLQQKGVISFDRPPAEPLTDAELYVQSYAHHLRCIQGLKPKTVAGYAQHVRSFLKHRFASGPVALSCLCAEDVVRFVQHAVQGLRPNSAKYITAVLRSFLRYACHLGETGPELVDAVPAVASWSMPGIPRGIGADQVDRLLSSISRSTATGRRDYALLLLLARLGLRASEIRFLELDDIDWINGTLRVKAKGNRRRNFPLSPELGEAIADYLQHGRPSCASRRVFLRAKSPIQGFQGQTTIGSIVRRAIQRAGVVTPTFSTHQFRHGLATDMLQSGSTLQQIGDVLGHSHPDTTRIYAKVDLDALRSLALPWPGDVQ